jgi:four helix bundle protein
MVRTRFPARFVAWILPLQLGMRWETDLKERSFQFGLAVLKLHARIASLGPHFADIARQLARASSSIGAHLQEADVAASRRDMALKQAVGLREAKESRHWIRMLIAAEVLVAELTPLYQESGEIVAMLTASVKKLRTD